DRHAPLGTADHDQLRPAHDVVCTRGRAMNVPLAALSFVLILARCAALVGFSPWLGGAETPRLVKVGLVVALSLVWFDPQAAAPAVVGSDPASWGWMLIGWLTAKEVLLGASLGYLLRLVVVPARMAGSY